MMAEPQIRQMRDFLDLFNSISENCFNRCIYTLADRQLTAQEGLCVDSCTLKFIYGGQAIMHTYVEVQPQMTERRIQEINKMMEENSANAEQGP